MEPTPARSRSFADTSKYLPKTNTLSPTREDSLLLMDATITDGQMTQHVEVFFHIVRL